MTRLQSKTGKGMKKFLVFSFQERGEAESTEREGSPMGAEKVLNLVVVA